MAIIALLALLTIPVAILWVRGIDYMQENHPDYKGEDLFNEEDEK
jgi:hypothetical protein